MAGARAGGGPDVAAGHWLRNFSVVDRTADRYNGSWRQFSRYCPTTGRCALPASTDTELAYVGWLWRSHRVVAITVKPKLAAVRKRHLAAGHAHPCDHDAVREARAGFRRADLAYRPVVKVKRVPLPSTVAWQLAQTAMVALLARGRRLTALVTQFWWLHRAADISRVMLHEVDLRADGATHYMVPRQETDARAGMLARSLHPSPHAPDLPNLLLRRLVAADGAAGKPPSTRLFTTCAPDDASTVLTSWLRRALHRLGVVALVGTWYASHSLKSGGATSANAVGIPRSAIAELSATTERTLADSYISALAVPSDCNRFVFARLLPHQGVVAGLLHLFGTSPAPSLYCNPSV